MPRGRSNRPPRSPQNAARAPRLAARRVAQRSTSDVRDGPDAAAILAAIPLEPLQTTLIVNPRGGLTIPRAMRSALAIDPGGSLIAQLTPEGVLLRPALTFPMSQCDVRQARTALNSEEGLEKFLRKRRRRFG